MVWKTLHVFLRKENDDAIVEESVDNAHVYMSICTQYTSIFPSKNNNNDSRQQKRKNKQDIASRMMRTTMISRSKNPSSSTSMTLPFLSSSTTCFLECPMAPSVLTQGVMETHGGVRQLTGGSRSRGAREGIHHRSESHDGGYTSVL